jgi:hypothetical protein
MGIITIVLVAASIRYSAAWHLYIGMHPFWGWGLAGAFIVFSTVCFDIGYGLIVEDNRNPRYNTRLIFRKSYRTRVISYGWAFIAIWFFITLYSMSSTVAGQYNQLLIKEKERSTVKETYKLESVVQDITGKNDEIETLRNPPIIPDETIKIIIEGIGSQEAILLDEKKTINKMISDTSGAQEAATYRSAIRDAYSRLGDIEVELNTLSEDKKLLLLSPVIDYDRISILQNEMEDLKIKRDILIDDGGRIGDDNQINQGTIFEYFSKIFGLSPLMIQFILSVFPAIFIDLISPISSALFFYGLYRHEEDDAYEKGKTYEDGKRDAFDAVNNEIQRRLRTTL